MRHLRSNRGMNISQRLDNIEKLFTEFAKDSEECRRRLVLLEDILKEIYKHNAERAGFLGSKKR